MLGPILLLAAILAPHCLCETLTEEKSAFETIIDYWNPDPVNYDPEFTYPSYYSIAHTSSSFFDYDGDHDYFTISLDCGFVYIDYYIGCDNVYTKCYTISSYDTNVFVLDGGEITVETWNLRGLTCSHWVTCDGDELYTLSADPNKFSSRCIQLLFPHVLWVLETFGYTLNVYYDVGYWIGQNYPDANILTEEEITSRYSELLYIYDCVSEDCE